MTRRPVSFSSRLPWPIRTNALSSLRNQMGAMGRPVLDFSESNPTRVGFAPPDGLLELLADNRNLQYEPEARGTRRAREALAESYAGRSEARSRSSRPAPDPSHLFLCSSTSEAYAWLFKLLCDAGEAVLVPKPGYPLFDHLAGLELIEARPYRLDYAHRDGWSIDLDSVATALMDGAVRAIVVINPNNPTGSYISPEEREALLQLCALHGCALIADEVFHDFPVELEEERAGLPARSSFLGEDAVLCFVLDGLSKSLGLPQMKLGWIAASGPAQELRQAVARLEIIADAYLSAGAPVMNALPALLRLAPAFVRQCRSRLVANILQLRALLEGPSSPHRVLRCDGGWTAIVESPRLAPDEELALGLLAEQGLWTQPGYFFDMEREGCFTASLILEPGILAGAARSYTAYFDRLLGR